MKALVIHAPNQASIEEVPYPSPKPNEVVVKVERVGICGTDFHIYSGEYIAQYPIIPGHEFSGTIVELGEQVNTLAIGDRVAAEPNIACGHCVYCMTQRQNHCENWQAVGVSRNGAMAEYVSVPYENLFLLPQHLSFADAAFLEPVACVIHGLNQLAPKIGQTALIIGAGAMGQQLIQGLTHLGISTLIVSEPSEAKRELALSYGATYALHPSELALFFKQSMPQQTVDLVIDVTGIPKVIEQAFSYLGKGGTFLQFGVTAKDAQISINPFHIFNYDWKIVGSKATNSTFYAALQWVSQKRINTELLVNRVITLEQLPALFQNGLIPTDLKVQAQL